jgi:uncharacterized pyridoxal phosphate-dependent enzyme
MNRREIIKTMSLLPLAGSLPALVTARNAGPVKRDIFAELGLRTFINAAGTYTAMTASQMPPEVLDAIRQSAQQYVMLEEVQDKVGAKIAAICHAEAAMVTAGCWSAIVLGTAGVLTGKDPEKIKRLPFLEESGMKSEVLIQKSHMHGYEHAVTNTGAKLVPVETAEEAEAAITRDTAMMWFLNSEVNGMISHQEWLNIAKKNGIPTMIDMAADVPPVENLWKFNDMGFDLVCVSGGKALCGPQSAGILMGRKELIAAARLNGPPGGGNIGRGMKVNKEEIIGMYVALDSYVKRDHAKEWKEWEAKIATINDTVKDIPGVKTEVVIPPVANHTPSLQISWDPAVIKLTKESMGEKLRNGQPSIETVSWEKDNSIRVTVFMLKPNQEKIVASRIKAELLNNRVS